MQHSTLELWIQDHRTDQRSSTAACRFFGCPRFHREHLSVRSGLHSHVSTVFYISNTATRKAVLGEGFAHHLVVYVSRKLPTGASELTMASQNGLHSWEPYIWGTSGKRNGGWWYVTVKGLDMVTCEGFALAKQGRIRLGSITVGLCWSVSDVGSVFPN